MQGPHFLLEHLLHPVLGDEDVGDLHAQLPGHLGPGTISLCLGWPDRSRDVSPYFLGHPDRIGPKGVVTILVEIA